MIEAKDIVHIGTLVRTHGKAGEVQCRTMNDYWDEADADFIVLLLDHIPVPFRVTDWRYKGEDLLLTLQTITTEERALQLVGSEVYMLRKDIQTMRETDMVDWQDLVGYTINGSTIRAIDDSTANILAALEDGRLIPLHGDLITAIDSTTHTISMTIPEGL